MTPSPSENLNLFPTCQVRVVRFYQSYSPPPRLAVLLPPPPRPPPPPSSFSSTISASISTSTSALPTLRQALCQFANSVYIGTSTWDLSSSVCTAGPQPGTFPAQWGTAGPQPGTFPAQRAPLDLNQEPSQLSVHRWTSTWDLPSPVYTTGPQPGICPAQCAPLDLNRGPSQLSVHCWTSTGR